MRVRDIGEFGLIERLARLVQEAGVGGSAPSGAFPLLAGIGDDTAAWQGERVTDLLTTDTMVEGTHFTAETTPWRDVGWKVMAANLSDIAAMGGTPLYALVTLGLPGDTPVRSLDDLYRGMIEICQEFETSLVGGDVVDSPVAFVSVALHGFHTSTPLLRSAARPGDLVAVTGPLGSSKGGLLLMTQRRPVDQEATLHLQEAHRRPRPRLREGRILVEQGVEAAMDISDGLIDDLSKMMKSSGCAARVQEAQVPKHPLLIRAFPQEALSLALGGGEEYQLLYTTSPQVMEKTLALIPQAATVGQVVEGAPGQVAVMDESGALVATSATGWDHFRSFPHDARDRSRS